MDNRLVVARGQEWSEYEYKEVAWRIFFVMVSQICTYY